MNSENQTSWSRNFLWHNRGSLINVTLSERSGSQYSSYRLELPQATMHIAQKFQVLHCQQKKRLRRFTTFKSFTL